MKRKGWIVLAVVLALLAGLAAAVYFGIRSSFKLYRNNGQFLRASAFEGEYHPVEHPLQTGFMTTVDKGDPTGCHLFFIHGGGCVMDAVPYHTQVICALADRGLRITAYDYPLFPETEYADICQAVYDAYGELRRLYPEDEIAVYGDSAGGTLALHLLMRLREEGVEKPPTRTVLVSPLLDLSLSNPEIRQYAPGDTSLNHSGSKLLGLYMAGPGKWKEPEFSPIYGDLSDLGEILLFYGSREILRPDCERLAEKIPGTEGTQITAYMGENRLHDYVMMVNDEASVFAFDRIAEFLQ